MTKTKTQQPTTAARLVSAFATHIEAQLIAIRRPITACWAAVDDDSAEDRALSGLDMALWSAIRRAQEMK
jgi:hypothetical protein